MNQSLVSRFLIAAAMLGASSALVVACGDGEGDDGPPTGATTIPDDLMIAMGYDPSLIDSNNNGIPDIDEDYDEDGLTNIVEYRLGLDPMNPDTDGNGTIDSLEDTDGDGAINFVEAWAPPVLGWDPGDPSDDPYVCAGGEGDVLAPYSGQTYRFTRTQIRIPGNNTIAALLNGLTANDTAAGVLNILATTRNSDNDRCYANFELTGSAGDEVRDPETDELLGYEYKDPSVVSFVPAIAVSIDDNTIYFQTRDFINLNFPIILPGDNGEALLPLSGIMAFGTIRDNRDGSVDLQFDLTGHITFEDARATEITIDGDRFQSVDALLTRDNGEPFSPYVPLDGTEPTGHYLEASIEASIVTLIDSEEVIVVIEK